MKTTKQIRLYVSILAALLISIVMTNCQAEEDLIQEKDTAAAVLYKEQITAFLGTLKPGSDKSQNAKIDDMLQALDNASIATVDLKSTEKLIIVKTNSLKDFETNDAVRLIFVQYQNKIFRSNIVTFKNSSDFNDHDALLKAIFDRKATKYDYSGTIKFHNPYQAAILELNYQQGELMWQGAVRNKNKQKAIQKSNGCTDWYWVTTYSDGHVKQEYLYTTCSCEEEAYRTANYCGGGGSGGSSSGNNPSTSTQPIQYPENPVDNQLFVYIDNDGQMIERKYNSATATWVITSITLSEVVINNNRENYNTEFYMIPNFNAKVKQNFFGIDFIFTYDPASASWEGQSEEAIADAIEDKIDDSKLDPCTKGVFQKIKTTTVCDFSEILSRLGAVKSVYKTIIKSEVPPNLQPAQTVWNSTNNYTLYISTDYVGKTKLFIAALMLHEMVHAHFISLYDEFYNSNPPNKNAYDDFPALFHYYVTLKRPSSLNAADFHHQQIAESYVAGIARALQEYQTGVPVEEGISPEQIYSDLAWGTLQQTPIFDSIYPIGNQNRQRILNRYQTEQTGYPAGQGTPQVQTPLGQPCN